jgi:hypothetical protein
MPQEEIFFCVLPDELSSWVSVGTHQAPDIHAYFMVSELMNFFVCINELQ